MQTSAISQRVSDFLRRHAPFDSIPQDDLLALCGRGRVKFHESDEFVYWQNARPNPFVYVVQRGAVSLLEERDGREHLRDLLGAGDIFGVEQFIGADRYRTSARTNCDVLLYAFHARDFEQLLERHPSIARFLSEQPQDEAEKTRAESPARAVRLGDLLPPATAAVRGASDGDMPLLFAPAMPAHDALLALAGSVHPAALVTEDGTPQGAPLGTVTGASIAAGLSAHPYTFFEQIPRAPDFRVLGWLHRQARQAMLQQLNVPGDMDWLAPFGHLLDRAILDRVLVLCGAADPAQSWCFFDAAGRRESLTPSQPSVALIGPVPESAEHLQRVCSALQECGYQGAGAQAGGSLEQWKERFSEWIADPLSSGLHGVRVFLDLSPAAGDPEPWRQLSAHVSAELQANPVFSALLANDALESSPPLTFFEDAVIDEAGRQSDHFDLARTALQPLVDSARAFGVAAGCGPGLSTMERLRLGNAGQAAEEALRTVLFFQARSGLRHGNAGHAIAPKELGRLDRHALKAAFRAIAQLLQATEQLLLKGAS